MGMTIRRLGPGDQAVLELLAREEPDFDVDQRGRPGTPLQPDEARRFLEDQSVLFWVAWDDSSVVGFLQCLVLLLRVGVGREVLLYEIGVRRLWRRRGVGRALMGEMERWMREETVCDVWVLADNVDAVEFYRAAGFVIDQPAPAYMVKRVDRDADEQSGQAPLMAESDESEIHQLARYEVRPDALGEVLAAIREFVAYVRAHEPGTLRYDVWQEDDEPTRFVRSFIFRDAEAHQVHSDSTAVKKFAAALYPNCLAPVEFIDYGSVASNAGPPTLANGKICYLEIPATDVDRSSEFYSAVFGWRIRRRGDGHLAFDDATGQVSGTWVTGREPLREPGLLAYTMVDSVAETIDSVLAHGGELVQAIGGDAPEITARFRDPGGNVVGLYQEPEGSGG